jgi:hypothetical protein
MNATTPSLLNRVIRGATTGRNGTNLIPFVPKFVNTSTNIGDVQYTLGVVRGDTVAFEKAGGKTVVLGHDIAPCGMVVRRCHSATSG